jgi:hypothetical protein
MPILEQYVDLGHPRCTVSEPPPWHIEFFKKRRHHGRKLSDVVELDFLRYGGALPGDESWGVVEFSLDAPASGADWERRHVAGWN